ncbi:thrombospondin type-1 domain-containing protein 1 [Amblyraja radiata]|uniref:thrombospondin type-1 domain-containing protein 1 n=1 Tax=Amblyraja radiata TaxID=386614 RepID=UPI001402B36B|nr:thrombospondin type-1 domain-containing protein 1 [Amblyraja radiata]
MSVRAAPGGGGGRAAAPLLPLLLLLCGCAVYGQLNYRLSGPPWHVALSDQTVHVDLRGVNGSGHNLSLTLVEAGTNRTLATVPGPVPLPGSLDLDCSLFRCAGELLFRLGEWSSRPLPVRWPRFQLWLAASSARSPGRFQLLLSSVQRLCPRAAPALTLHTGPGPGLHLRLGPGGLERGPGGLERGPRTELGRGPERGQEPGMAPEPGMNRGPGRGPGPGVLEGEPERGSGPGGLERGPGTRLERPDPKRGPEPWRDQDQEPGESEGPELEPRTGLEKGPEEPAGVPGWEVRLELPCPPRSRGSAWTVSLRSPCSPTPLLSRTVRPRYSLKLPAAPCRHSAAGHRVPGVAAATATDAAGLTPPGRPIPRIHTALYQPPSRIHTALYHPPSRIHTALYHPIPRLHTALYQPPSRIHTALYHPIPRIHTALYHPIPRVHTALYHPPSRVHTALYHPPSRVHTALYHPIPRVHTALYHPIPRIHTALYHPIPRVHTALYHPIPRAHTALYHPIPRVHTALYHPIPRIHTALYHPIPRVHTALYHPIPRAPSPPVPSLSPSPPPPPHPTPSRPPPPPPPSPHPAPAPPCPPSPPPPTHPASPLPSTTARPPVLAQSWLPPGDSIARFKCSVFESGTHEYCFQFVSADTPGAGSPVRCVILHRHPETRGAWLSWSPCSVTCGEGVRQRVRRCLTSSPGTNGCGADSEVSLCSLLECSGQGGPAKVHNTSNIVTITGISFCLLVILATIAITLRTKLSCKGPDSNGADLCVPARQADMVPEHDPSARLDAAVNIPLGFRRSQVFVPSEEAAQEEGGWVQDTQKAVPPIFGYRLAQQQLKEMQRQGVTEGTQVYLVTQQAGGGALPSPGKDDSADSVANTFRLKWPFPAHTPSHCPLPSRDQLAVPPFPQLDLPLPPASRSPGAAGHWDGAAGPGSRGGGGRSLAAGFRRAASFGESGAAQYYRERSRSSPSHRPRAGEPATAGDRCGNMLPVTSSDRCGNMLPITSGDRCGNKLPVTSSDRCGNMLPVTSVARCSNKLPNTSGNICGTNKLPITSGDRCTNKLPITAGDRCGTRLPETSGDRCGNKLPITAGDGCGNELPITADDRCGTRLPETSGDRCGTNRLSITSGHKCANRWPATTGDRCGTDRLPTTAANHKQPSTAGDRCGSELSTTAGDRCAGIHMCDHHSAAAAETAGGGADGLGVSWVFGEVDTFPGRRQRGGPGDGAEPGRAQGSSPLSRHLCRQGRCRSFPSEPAAMHFDNTAFELSASEQRIIDLPALFGPHSPGDEDSSTFSSDRLVI